MNEIALLQNYLIVGALLFGVGLVGFLTRRNFIVMFLAAELMLQGISLSLVAWSRYHKHLDGQMLVIFIIAIAACEAAIALALALMLFRRAGNLDVAVWQQMREDNLPEHVDHEIPAPPSEADLWPELTPAGVKPQTDPTKTPHRSNV